MKQPIFTKGENMSKKPQEQMTFDFGFDDDRTSSGSSLPEIVDIGDAEDSLGLPPSGIPEGEESLSFSSPEEYEIDPEEEMEEENDFLSGKEETASDDMEIEGVEIFTGDEDQISDDEKGSAFLPAENGQVTEQEDTEEAEGEVIPVKKAKELPFDAKNIKRAALAFLASLSPDALAENVPVRYRKYIVDGAAFWSRSGKKGKVEVYRTAIADVLLKEEASGMMGSRENLSLLEEARKNLSLIEARLRAEDPAVKVSDSLFAEDDKWDYSKTKDPAYREALARIKELEKNLFAGTKFDKLRKSGIATEYYVAVPENLIDASSVAQEWGLVYILPDLSFKLVKEAGKLPCTEESMNSLALNIGRMTISNVLFANGIHCKNDTVKVVRVPRKRRF